MPRPRPYDLDELMAFWESGNYRNAPEVMEVLGIPDEHRRSVQKAINRYCGPRPRRPEWRKDPLRRRVTAWMVAQGLNLDPPIDCVRWAAWESENALLTWENATCLRSA